MKDNVLNYSIKLITNNNNYSKDQIDIIKYGLEAIYLTITKLIVIVTVAFFLGILKEMFFLLVTYNIIRSQAFGIHASKSSYCLLSSLVAFIGGTLFCMYIIIPKIIMIIGSLICNICLFLYAPADTYKRPIVNSKKRKRFKLLSSLLGAIYTILIIFVDNYQITNYLFVGMILSVVMILPITYIIFKFPYNNYKRYERGV